MPKRRSRPRRAIVYRCGVRSTRVLLAMCLTALLGACLPPEAHYSWGLGTSRISGFVHTDPKRPVPGGPLVVVYERHHEFVTYANGSAVLRTTARVVQPGRAGDFSIEVPSDVVRMDFLFIAPDHLTETFHFQRQLGVGDIEYDANLKAIDDWRSHYYTFLSPQLQDLIVDPRYHVPPAEQQLLGQWMQRQDARLNKGAGHS